MFSQFWSLYSVPADGSSPPQVLLQPDAPSISLFPLAWSGKGPLVYSRASAETSRDIYTYRAKEDIRAVVTTVRDERAGMLSPDGRWMLYAALEPGREEQVYMQPYPGPGERVIVSQGGGREPIWSPTGKEIFYRSNDGQRMLAVDVQTDPLVRIGPPRTLFEGHYRRREY